jgi:hypothetical protein
MEYVLGKRRLMMIVSENLKENERGDFVSKDGRVFRPLYGDMLKKMPKDIVRELARRRLEEIAPLKK